MEKTGCFFGCSGAVKGDASKHRKHTHSRTNVGKRWLLPQPFARRPDSLHCIDLLCFNATIGTTKRICVIILASVAQTKNLVAGSVIFDD